MADLPIAPSTSIAPRHPSRAAAPRTLRVLLSGLVLAGSLSFAPASAFASRLSTDRIAGIPRSAGEVPASAWPDISARSGALVGSDGRMLWTRKTMARRSMASTTKVMTALVVLERRDLDEVVRVSSAAARTRYRTGLHTGERLTVRKLLELTLVASSNDAAAALAISTGGSISGFSKMMNKRASELGLTDTHYKNPHGLDTSGHYSSALDTSRLMREARKHSEFRRIVGMRSVYLARHRSRPARRIKTTNRLLGVVDGMRGGKTGFTDDARYCFVGTASRDGVMLTSVVLGSPSSADRFTSSRRLLEWGFKHYRIRQLCANTQSAGTLPISGTTSQTVGVRYAKTVRQPALDVLGPIVQVPSLPTSATVPIFAGQKLGEVRFVQAAQVLATVDVVAAETVEATSQP